MGSIPDKAFSMNQHGSGRGDKYPELNQNLATFTFTFQSCSIFQDFCTNRTELQQSLPAMFVDVSKGHDTSSVEKRTLKSLQTSSSEPYCSTGSGRVVLPSILSTCSDWLCCTIIVDSTGSTWGTLTSRGQWRAEQGARLLIILLLLV